MKSTSLLFAIACTLLLACNQPSSNESYTVTTDDLLADTISYPVRIKNINPEDEWASLRLKNLKTKQLVDDVFNAIYSEKAQAFNYLTDAPIDKATIQAQETDSTINRNDIVELEFRETWWYNADHSVFRKKVQSILVASALYDSDGSFRGMKALFYVKMKD